MEFRRVLCRAKLPHSGKQQARVAIAVEAVTLRDCMGIGRLPIRVEFKALTEEDFIAILTETKASLPEQYKALLATEEVIIEMREDALQIGRASGWERVGHDE